MAGTSWCADNGVSAYTRVTGLIPSNNMAKTVAVMMVLRSWPSVSLHIHMDSRFVIGLVEGGLLAMERDGWPDMPYTNYSNPSSLVTLFK